MKEYAKSFYTGKQWKDTRDAYFKSKQGLCEKCLETCTITAGVIVHHKKPITQKNINNPNITLNWDNLQVLCRACHEKAHRKKSKRYTVDATTGQITPAPDNEIAPPIFLG